MRYFVEIAFKGTHFYGMQKQKQGKTVQGEIERVLGVVLQQETPIQMSGRTDAGVHALQMFVHFDTDKNLNLEDCKYRLNSMLDSDIAVYAIYPVSQDAHTRFDAIERVYEYRIIQEKDPFLRELTAFYPYDLDIESMNKAASKLMQYNDFSSFAKTHTDVKTHICDIQFAYWEQHEHQLIFTISADRFLRNMVRAIVGTLIDVGRGKISIELFEEIIQKKDRNFASTSAAAAGLFLKQVKYPKELFI